MVFCYQATKQQSAIHSRPRILTVRLIELVPFTDDLVFLLELDDRVLVELLDVPLRLGSLMFTFPPTDFVFVSVLVTVLFYA